MIAIYQILTFSEMIIYCVIVSICSVRLFGAYCSRSKMIFSFILLFAPVLAIELFRDDMLSRAVLIVFPAPEILCLKLCLSHLHVRTIFLQNCCIKFCNVIAVSSLMTVLPNNTVISQLIKFAVYVVMLIFCLLTCFTPLRVKVKALFDWTPKSTKLILFIMLAGNAFLSTLLMYPTLYLNPVLCNVVKIIFMLLLLSDGLIVSVLLVYTISNKHISSVAEIYESQIKIQSDYYKKLSESNFELRRFRHDYANLCIGMEKLLSEGKTEEALKMLQKGHKDLTKLCLAYNTGNGIVDALLEDKAQKAERMRTKIVFEGAVPEERLQMPDLCVIFGNTLDNALDACSRLDETQEKTITVQCHCSSGFMFIQITNPVRERIHIAGTLPLTTKKNKKEHGFGLYSLKKVIRKYDGTVQCKCDDQYFSIDISLQIP